LLPVPGRTADNGLPERKKTIAADRMQQSAVYYKIVPVLERAEIYNDGAGAGQPVCPILPGGHTGKRREGRQPSLADDHRPPY